MIYFYRKIEKVVSPQKWDVLIRIIDNADQAVARRSSAASTESTTTYGGRKTTASSQSAQELRYAHFKGKFLKYQNLKHYQNFSCLYYGKSFF